MNVEPLRNALLSLAEANAERELAEADERAAAELRHSEQEADALVERSRAEGEAAAERAASRLRAEARTQARTIVLQARREVYEHFVAESQAAAGRLRDDPGYPALLERLAAAARERLGDDAELEIDVPGRGGVRGRRGRRYVDYSLPVLVDDCIERLGTRLQELWS